MSCLSRSALEQWLADELAEPQRPSCAAHLRMCATCQAAAEAIIAEIDVLPSGRSLQWSVSDCGNRLDALLDCLKRLPESTSERRAENPTLCDTALQAVSAPDTDPTLDVSVTAGPASCDVDAAVGTQIGPYRLVAKLGQGGFGNVYRAEQVQPLRRTVALKLLKPGMDTSEVIARFEAERQALALMDHPHIARVLDAGTSDQGRPYFVMELVDGIPITQYCDAQRLTIRGRLELFITVCQAVQHAHQKGIIHRDLKPSNVLVAERDGQPEPKVIDFGIAKALGCDVNVAAATTVGQMVGTPLYMSPEQVVHAGDVDTRSDVYALGVLFYELLTGTTPVDRERYSSQAVWEVLRAIREDDIQLPSLRVADLAVRAHSIATKRNATPRELVRRLRADLDWIAVKALEADRERRYPTASALAADVERVLSDAPVEACPPSKLYRARKFVRRNQLLLSATAAVFGALVAGSTVALWQANRARFERDRADTKAALAQRAENNATQSAEVTRDLLYSAEVRLAAARHFAGDDQQAQTLLNRWVPQGSEYDRRGIEWRLLKAFLHVPGEELMRLTGPSATDNSPVHDVSCVRVAPDSTWLAAATDGGVVRRYSLGENRELPSWETQLKDVRRIAFSPDGKLLALIGYETDTVIVDTASGAVLHRLPRPLEPVGSPDVEFLDSTTLLQTGQSGVVNFWDATTGALKRGFQVPRRYRIHDCATSPAVDGFAVLTPYIDSASSVDVFSGEDGGKLCEGFYVDSGDNVLALSHNGQYAAVGGKKGVVLVYDWRRGQQLAEFKLFDVIHDMAFSADDAHLAVAEKTGTVHVIRWEKERIASSETDQIHFTGKLDQITMLRGGIVQVYPKGHSTFRLDVDAQQVQVLSHAVTSQTTVEIVGRPGKPEHTMVELDEPRTHHSGEHVYQPGDRIRDLSKSSRVHWQAHPKNARSVAFLPDGRQLISAGVDGRIVRWSWDHSPARLIDVNSPSITWVPQSRLVACICGDAVRLFDCESHELVRELLPTPGASTRSVCCHPDGSRLFIGYADRNVGVWDIREGTTCSLPDSHMGDEWYALFGCAVDPSLVVALTKNRRGELQRLRCWNVAADKRLYEHVFGPDHYRACALQANVSRLFIVSTDRLRAFDVHTGAEAPSLPFDGREVLCLTASPAGELLAVGSSEREVSLVQASTGKIVRKLLGHLGALLKLEFTADGRTLFSLDERGVLKLWQVSNGNEYFTWQFESPVTDFSLSPDGRWLALMHNYEAEIISVPPVHELP